MFTNTQLFRESAEYFLKNKRYDAGIPFSDDWNDYWDREEDRMLNGMVIGDVAITGEHYGYMNYAQIRLTEDPDFKGESVVKRKKGTKTTTFPAFWDGDYTYFWAKYIAREGIEKEFYEKYVKPHMLCRIPEEFLYDGGHHLCVGKKRRAGYSYKNGWIAAHRYNFIPEALTAICAFDKKYLYPKGTMQMASSYVDFINGHTDWAKKKLIDKQDHLKAGFIETNEEGIDIDMGYLSEIMAITFGGNPGAARGKDADLILVEESGAAPNLLDFEAATKPTVEDGLYVTGMMIYFGTGGGDNAYWEGFEEIFYHPLTYNMLPIYNDWDEGASSTFCSFFVPEFWNMPGAIDDQGNSMVDKATEIALERREDIRVQSKGGSALTKHMMERPFRPSEAFAVSGSNIFPVLDLQSHLNYVKSNNLHIGMGTVVELYQGMDGVELKINENINAIYEFPHSKKLDLTGGVVIYEKPKKVEGVVPRGLYRICNDPYGQDNSTSGESLGSTYVIMNPNKQFAPGDRIVACYHGRPKTQDDYNRILFMLAELYNCQIGFENDRGDVIGYAKRFKLLHKLAPEFELAFNANIPKSSVKRGFGMHIGSGKDDTRKLQGDIYIRDWLITPRSISEDGKVLLNLHLIYDIGLLQELIKYKPGGNFDRVSSFRIGIYYEKELVYKGVHARSTEKKKNSMFNRPLYQ